MSEPAGTVAEIVAAFASAAEHLPPCRDHLMLLDMIVRCDRCSKKASEEAVRIIRATQ